MAAANGADVIRYALKPQSIWRGGTPGIYRDGTPVVVARGEPLTRDDIAQTFTPDQLAARDGRYLAVMPPQPLRPAPIPSTPAESPEHTEARLALEAVVERFASARSIERPPVRQALEADAASFAVPVTHWVKNDAGVAIAVERPGLVVDIPREVRITFRALRRELAKIEKREAAT